MESLFLVTVGAAAVRAATPILLASLGEILAERAGVLNLGLEGLMLAGALAGFSVAVESGSVALGLLSACCAASLLALLHAWVSVTLRANQVVSGISTVFLATGATELFGRTYVGMTVSGLQSVTVPVLGQLPVLGPIAFRQDAIVYASWTLVVVLWYGLFRTQVGMQVRAVGESPEAADAMGVSVASVRYAATTVGGALAGLGGAYLSLVYTPLWVSQMTAGRGWIAIALVVFARWNPLYALPGAALFGGIDALQLRLQASGSTIAPHLLLTLPYLSTIAALALTPAARRQAAFGIPSALGRPFSRESGR